MRRKSREDQIRRTVWKDGKPQNKEVRQHTDEMLGSWFKVTVSVLVTTAAFHCDKHRIRFFVQDVSTACALKDVSYKMYDEDSQKIPVFVNPSDVPYSVLNRFTGEQMEQLKLLSLNLSNNKLIRLDSLFDVVEKAPQVKILNLSTNQLRTAWELEKMKGLKLKELWLEGNPMCSTFSDNSAYVRSGLCEYFKDDIDMKNPKEFYLQRQLLKYTKQDIVDFLRALPKTLHVLSSFQVDMCFQTVSISFCLRTRPYVVRNLCSTLSLCRLLFQDTMLCFSVSGLFKEVEGSSQGYIRGFMRTFIATLDRKSSNLCIVNDQLFLRNPSPDEIQGAFAVPLSTSCSTFKPVLSQEQQRMVWDFSNQSGMKLEWSQK
ncbi:hypothetical protein NN561_013140 [Cricetulus griseus]